mgnify:CR=1 FL=1
MTKHEKGLKETGRKFMLPFYVMKLTLKVSPAYLAVTAGIAVVSAVSPILNVWLTQQILAGLLSGEGNRKLFFLVVCLVAANFFCMGANRYLTVKQGVFSERFRDDFKCYVGERIMCMDYSQLEDSRVMDLKDRALRPIIDYGVLDLMLRETIPTILSSLFLMMGTAAIAAAGYPVLLLALFVMAGINLHFVNQTRKTKDETYQVILPVERKIGAYNGMTADFSIGKDIRLYDMGGILMDKIRRLNRTDLKALSAQFGRISRSAGLSSLLSQLQLFAIYGLLAVWAMQGKLGIAEYAFYTGIFLNLGTALFRISDKMSDLFYTGKFFSAFREFEELSMRKDGKAKSFADAPQVEVRDISFSYPGVSEPVLKNLSLTISKGERLAIVGRNGAGKTTLVKLLCGLYRPDSGQILFDGEQIGGMEGLSAAVFQDFKLFAYTLYDNVVMGRDEDAELMPIFERVGLESTVEGLPEREHSYLYKLFEPTGVELSGGNEQRLAIARALYRDAPVLILDEPTAALDPVSEEEIFHSFREISHGKTSVMISHRLSATRLCDRIVVLQDGCIVEEGSHEELMGVENGIYRNMFETQAQYYQEQQEREVCH